MSPNLETKLKQVFSNRLEMKNYTHCAYSKSNCFFYRHSIIMSEDGTQQTDGRNTTVSSH